MRYSVHYKTLEIAFSNMSKRKPLTADKLIKALQNICDEHNVDPKKVIIMFRRTMISYPLPVNSASEDLFDSETNQILESIMLYHDPR